MSTRRIRALLLGAAAVAALSACTPNAAAPSPAADSTGAGHTLQLDLPAVPEDLGTDAGLITDPAPGSTATPARASASAAARPVGRAPASAVQPKPAAPAPAARAVPPPAVQPAPAVDPCYREDAECYGTDTPQVDAPTGDDCGFADPSVPGGWVATDCQVESGPVADDSGVQGQLDSERLGSYRCDDPAQVIVAINPDVCGAP